MKGLGGAWGAVTIVNALATGVGCAAAVSVRAEVAVELESARGRMPTIAIPLGSDTPLVRATLMESLRRFLPERAADVRVSVRSEVPAARGLKSSSAVSVALSRAIATAVGRRAEPEELARISSTVSRDIGLSATGAFDDALACAAGGVVVTRNGADEVLRMDALDPEWRAVLWIPRQPHPPSAQWIGAFREREGEGRAAASLACAGRYLDALERNTELVERIMGYDYRPLREELSRRGAVGSGVSGMGPTLAALVPAPRSSAVSSAFPVGMAELLTVDLAPRSSPEGSGDGR